LGAFTTLAGAGEAAAGAAAAEEVVAGVAVVEAVAEAEVFVVLAILLVGLYPL
jgi:hypothetical protein